MLILARSYPPGSDKAFLILIPGLLLAVLLGRAIWNLIRYILARRTLR